LLHGVYSRDAVIGLSYSFDDTQEKAWWLVAALPGARRQLRCPDAKTLSVGWAEPLSGNLVFGRWRISLRKHKIFKVVVFSVLLVYAFLSAQNSALPGRLEVNDLLLLELLPLKWAGSPKFRFIAPDGM
jgi:hypothetical protein